MMNKFLPVLLGFGLLLVGQAVAQDSFDREFSRFDKDFERLNSWKAETPVSKRLKRVPATQTPETANQNGGATTPLNDEAPASANKPTPANTDDATPATTQGKTSALPKGTKVETLTRNDLIGNQISDPAVRKKVQDLYRRPDVVVQQYVLPTN